MNKKRRKKIWGIITLLEKGMDVRDKLEDVLYEEQDTFDNIPENLQYSLRGEESQEAIEAMEEAMDLIDEGKLDEAAEVLGVI